MDAQSEQSSEGMLKRVNNAETLEEAVIMFEEICSLPPAVRDILYKNGDTEIKLFIAQCPKMEEYGLDSDCPTALQWKSLHKTSVEISEAAGDPISLAVIDVYMYCVGLVESKQLFPNNKA